ncbi:HI0074 family nucleotidyltransferase substrate-binding subunit [Patescibacteria group bacterium]
MSKTKSLLAEFKKATKRLEEVLAEPKTTIVRDSAIQRFEFCLDLSWKTLKSHLQEKLGVAVASPKKCFREAFQQGIVEYDEFWLTLVDLRNETVHAYNEKRAESIFKQLPKALKYFEKLVKKIAA